MMLPIIDIKLTPSQLKKLAPLFEALADYNAAHENMDSEKAPSLLMQPYMNGGVCRVGFIDSLAGHQVRAAFHRSRKREEGKESGK